MSSDSIYKRAKSAQRIASGSKGVPNQVQRDPVPTNHATPFRSTRYIRHNARRMEHLATLGLPLEGQTVLELGAGIGDHTTYFLDRGCKVTLIEGRAENIELLRHSFASEHKWVEGIDFIVIQADLDAPEPIKVAPHQVVFCYGLLYHLGDPIRLLKWAAPLCSELMLCETCVTYEDSGQGANVPENAVSPTQALNGVGARPTRREVMSALEKLFPHVYVPATQPWHEEFPTDWTQPHPQARSARAIFIATRRSLPPSPLILDYLPDHYGRT